MEITGVIQSGAGKGAFFTQVDWVVHQCEDKLGYKPYPGTLNVRVTDSDRPKLAEFFQGADFELIPDDPAFCAAQVIRVEVDGIPGAVILPSEDVRIHADNVVEVIASCGLKQKLGLQDGSVVKLTRRM